MSLRVDIPYNNNASTYLDGTGNFTTPAGGGSPGGAVDDVQYKAGASTFGGITMTNGQILVGVTANPPSAVPISGDSTGITTGGALTITKTNGVAFAASATTDTTNATNISSGTLAPGRLPILGAVCTSQLSKNLDVTLANITGMTVSLLAGKTYLVHGALFTTSGASGGVKMALANNDTLTVTSFVLGATPMGAGGQNTTSLGTGIGATSAINVVEFDATVVVNAAGTLVVQGAQNASNSTSTVFLVNSYILAHQIN